MSEAATTPIECPLSDREQTRNVLIVGVNTALSYLASPVLYVGVMHTSLLDDLQRNAGFAERSDALSNSPASAYMIFSAMPLLVAWAFPQVRLLRPILLLCYLVVALASAAMVAVLLTPLPFYVQAGAVILHGAVMGSFRTVLVAFEFEVLGVAVSEAKRGRALGIAYGFGPILAVLGNLLAQFLLSGIAGVKIDGLDSPYNFAAVFAFTVPVLLIATFLCSQVIIPMPEHEHVRQPFLTGIFGGLGSFLGRRVTLIAVISSVLVFCGYQVIGNLNLYSGALLGDRASAMAGYQNAIRYTCKVMMGVSMGWLLTRAAPRSAVWIAALAGMSGIVFAIFAPPSIFLLSFGLLGAGELHGIYATNYILSCAPKRLMRKFMAFAMVMMLPAAPFGNIYGLISDYAGDAYGKLFGYQMSFVLAASLVFIGIVLVFSLPGRPKPAE